jgi:hypothetical protein
MKRRLSTVLVLTSFALFAMMPRVYAVPIISAGSATVTNGDTFTIPISITGAVNLTSFQFDLAFGPSILQVTATGVTENAFFAQGDSTVFISGFVDNTAGSILGVADALIFQSPVNGDGVLADVEFKAIGAGTSPLTLSNVFLNLSDSGFSVTNGAVCVHPVGATTCGSSNVPEPGTVALLAMGLGLLTWRRRLNAF